MLAKRPPMGWNSWNTFGKNISEQLIFEIADAMVEKGYRDAGYNYLVIDDCWSERSRDAQGQLVADPVKFPHGMKHVADYVHSRGLKFGMYSCAGVMTCAKYPGSFGHEFEDARAFAGWGVDFLKYDFCNFPKSAHCQTMYRRMGMALKACGREILFSACNWGVEEPGEWMRSAGAQMYRSTGDINDSFASIRDIAQSQIDKLCYSGYGCFNDMDMLVTGMYGKGNVALTGCSDMEYLTHHALWCLFGVPLMIGGDVRALSEESRSILLNPGLLAIDQDEECRPPYQVNPGEDAMPIFFRHLADHTFALAFFNFDDEREHTADCILEDIGLPYGSGLGLELTDAVSGERIGVQRDYFSVTLPAHGCRVFRAKIAEA